jgi:hypothetical protein
VAALFMASAGCDSGREGGPAPAARSATPPSAVASATRAGAVLASREGTFDHSEFRVDVVEFARNGGFVNLTFTATATKAGSPLGWQVNNAFSAVPKPDPNVDGVFLIDVRNARKHLVALDSAGGCVCSGVQKLFLAVGESATLSATYAAPPADATAMDVHIPNAGTLANVPLG